ncbi:hypothetical protein HZB03_00740 [Candidatus Woesearchaeota archaeon]|nr:hypothetical protein [Candidatus Woesearchaeota archaeon]
MMDKLSQKLTGDNSLVQAFTAGFIVGNIAELVTHYDLSHDYPAMLLTGLIAALPIGMLSEVADNTKDGIKHVASAYSGCIAGELFIYFIDKWRY